MREDPGKNMSPPPSREERLAAKLRENLRRRKAQARAVSESRSESDRAQPLPNRPPES